MLYEYDGFKAGDWVISTLAKQPSTVRVIAYFIRFTESIRVYFASTDNEPQTATDFPSWQYKPGLLLKID